MYVRIHNFHFDEHNMNLGVRPGFVLGLWIETTDRKMIIHYADQIISSKYN